MNNLEDLGTIENYLNGQLPADERAQFETVLRTDPAVADALKFYVLTKEAARQQAREQRIAELEALRRQPVRSIGSVPMRWAAAASVVLLLGLGWVFFQNGNGSADPVQMADAYVTTTYDKLNNQMGGGPADQLSRGVDLYNQQKYAAAEAAFTEVLTQQPGNDSALKYSGLTAYRQGKYDQAIERFSRLNALPDRLDRSGIILEALARLKRDQPMDKEQAKNLLQQVVRENLEGKDEAEKLMKALN